LNEERKRKRHKRQLAQQRTYSQPECSPCFELICSSLDHSEVRILIAECAHFKVTTGMVVGQSEMTYRI
jgi:hypothetical protein